LEGEPWAYVAGEADLDMIDKVHEFLPWRRDRRPELYGIITSSQREGFEAKLKTRIPSMLERS
jgi:hypothetical protein